ncbi:MAG TPA: hypothetical protein VF173_19820 [Thermoanaerobaculia bacterium]|nr:hypothetical protein [Thermoanaerobaculia bacterium]
MRRTLVAVALASSLVSLPPAGFLQPLWVLVSSLWGQPAQEGCRIDPDGRCAPQSTLPLPTPRTDTGCHIDPDGACLRPAQPLAAPAADTGCHIDPNGLCRF